MKRTRRSLIVKGDENVLAKRHEDDKVEISSRPLAKKSRMIKTGKWTDEERLRLLTAFRKHGSGKWMEISSIVGTRDKIQVKSYGQKLATKMKNGVDIFADLHEDEHGKGGHFGATEPSSSQVAVKSVEPDNQESVRAKKQHAAKVVVKNESLFVENLMGVLSAPYEGRGADVQVTFLPLLCIDIEREQIVGCERLEKCGCVVDVFLGPSTFSLHIERIEYLTRRRLEHAYKTRRRSSSVLDDALHHLLCLQTDDVKDILDAFARFQRMESSVRNPFIVLGKDELEWWSGIPIRQEESTSLRAFALLRRLAMPLCMRSHSNVKETVSFPDFSLLDILLRIEISQSATVDGLMLRIVQLERVASRASATLESLARDLQRRLLLSINEAARINCVDRARYLDSVKFMLAVSSHPSGLRKMVSEELSDVLEPSDINVNRVVELQRDSETYGAIAKAWKIPTNQGWQSNQLAWTKRSIVRFEARSCPNEINEGELLIQNMKQAVLGKKDIKEVMHEFLTEKLAKKSDILAGRNDGGSLWITSSEMSLERFLQHAGLMNQINGDFHRPVDRPESRPRLRALNMSESCITTIKSVFFDEDGSLRNEIKNDIDMSLKHGYINFSNTSCSNARNDKRWQVPIRHHNQLRRMGARHTLESALEAQQVVFPQFETLDDVALLIAGTEDQALHHDVARAFSAWVSKVNYNAEEEDPVAGWEVGRIDYNEAMASPYAPSSVILGMGEGTTAFLGVQKDQIKRVTSGKCMVVGGTGETFDIVRETEHLVVIRAERGLMFTGDFPHAGVRNVLQESPENDLVELLKERISNILGDESLSSRGKLTAIVDMLCDFPGLNKLCRFHCTTQLLDGKMKPPLNTVGFTGCLPKHPNGCSILSTSLQTLEMTTPPARVSPSPPKLVAQKRIGKEDDIPRKDGIGIPDMAPEDLYPLVLPEDKSLIFGHLYLTFGQMQPCLFMEADKVGRYKTREVGIHGLACKYCVGKAGRGRYFPVSEASLSQTSSHRTIMNHVRNCPGCPIEIRDYLELLPWLKRAKMEPDGKKAETSKQGGQKVFFHRLWCRIQGLPMDEKKTIHKKRDKDSYARKKGSYAQKGQRRSSSSDAFCDSQGSEEENGTLFKRDDETESEYEQTETSTDEDEIDDEFKLKPPARATEPKTRASSLKKSAEKGGKQASGSGFPGGLT